MVKEYAKMTVFIMWIIFISYCTRWCAGRLPYQVGQKISAEWKDHAASTGHAEYYLDQNNERQFRWLPTKSNPQPKDTNHDNN